MILNSQNQKKKSKHSGNEIHCKSLVTDIGKIHQFMRTCYLVGLQQFDSIPSLRDLQEICPDPDEHCRPQCRQDPHYHPVWEQDCVKPHKVTAAASFTVRFKQ